MNDQWDGLLQRILHTGNGPVPTQAADQFHQAAQSASPDTLSRGLAAAFNSEQTPSFGEMVGHMFGHANTEQKTGIVNRLLSGLGPSALGLLAQMGLNNLPGHSGTAPPNLTGEQVAQLSPGQVEQLATHAQTVNPGIVESMSNFYAQHPVLVKSLGAVALAIILRNLGHRAA